MLNRDLVEAAIKNKNYHFKSLKNMCSAEVFDDVFQNFLFSLLNKKNPISIDDLKTYVNASLKRGIYENNKKNGRFVDINLKNYGDKRSDDSSFKTLFDFMCQDKCYFEETEEYEHTQFLLKEMHSHINNLHSKQKEAVLAVLDGNGSTGDANFKQAMRNLRNAMGGRIFKTNPDKHKPKYERGGVQGSLSREAVLDIRANVVPDSKGNLTKKTYYAKKYSVSNKVIYLVAKGINYKHIK